MTYAVTYIHNRVNSATHPVGTVLAPSDVEDEAEGVKRRQGNIAQGNPAAEPIRQVVRR